MPRYSLIIYPSFVFPLEYYGIGKCFIIIMLASLIPSCSACDSSGEFQAFATTHPEYAKLFTTYLELQRYQAIQQATPGDLELACQTSSGEKQEDSTSDKKDD